MPAPVQVACHPISRPSLGVNNYQGFRPGKTEILPKGWSRNKQRALTSEIQAEYDVEIVVRDGCRLYVDVFRPIDDSKKVPAVLSWSPFGKNYDGITMLKITPYNCGVIPSDISSLEKFEGVDPARWVPRGFAVINVDARGAGNSDGSVAIMGTQEGEDGYDVIEHIAKLPWCNGSVGLAGNSHLAIVQWFIAALQPPSLKAIAPWEGCSDMYREQFVRGGTFNLSNFVRNYGLSSNGLIQKHIIQGGHGVEDFQEMHRRSPLMNSYWSDKRANMKAIKIPAYITGSDFGSIHTMGSLRGFMELGTPDKWIRWCGYQEWHDLWAVPETNEELMRFFGKFLKGENNGFEETPRVRWSALQFGDREAKQNIVLPDFPVPNTDYREFFFAPDQKLVTDCPTGEYSVEYASGANAESTSFTWAFDQDVRLIGLPKAHLFMSCPDNDDFSICVELQKLDSSGKKLRHLNIPFARAPFKSMSELPANFNNGLIVFSGSTGLLRASHRRIDKSKSIHPQYPFHPHDRQELVKPGEIVELEVGIWAMGVDYDKGEMLRVVVSGTNPTWPELQDSSMSASERDVNKGRHIVHIGGSHPSRVILPFVNRS